MGRAFNGELLVVVTPIEAIISALSARDEPAGASANSMKKKASNGMRQEYDFPRARRGKYARRYAEGTNAVLLEPDVAKVFRDSKAVNVLLRKLIRQQTSAAMK